MRMLKHRTLLTLTLLGFLWAQLAMVQHSVEHELLHGEKHCELELGIAQGGNAITPPAIQIFPVSVTFIRQEISCRTDFFFSLSTKGFHSQAPPFSFS